MAKPVRKLLAKSAGYALCGGLLLVLQARLLALACHRVVIDHHPLQLLLPFIAGIGLCGLCRGAALRFAEVSAGEAALQVKEAVRDRLYRHLLEIGPTGIREDAATLAETVTAGVEGLEPYLAKFLPHAVVAAALPPALLAFVFPFDWRPGLLMLFSAPFIPLFMILIGGGAERLSRKQWTKLTRMSGHLLDLVRGLPDLRIFGAVTREAEAVARVSEEYRAATMGVLRIAFLSALALEFFSTVSTAVVAVLVGFRLLAGGLTLADGLFVLILAPEFYLPLRMLGLHYHARMQGIAAAEAIAKLLSQTRPGEMEGTEKVPEGALTISFRDVSFAYDDGRGILRGIALDLPPGKVTGIAGASGSGKSTLVRLLLGFISPSSGSITVNGTDLASLDRHQWRNRLAWVPQQPFFFAGTVRDNLLLGKPDATDREIDAALEAAAADAFVAALPHGLESRLGDRGAGLSGGELRRLALARAFLRDAALVVLDEPTAGLDPENERVAGESLARLAQGRTVLVISHREETLSRADRLYVLAGGVPDGIGKGEA